MNGLRRKGKSDFNAGIDASDTLQQLAGWQAIKARLLLAEHAALKEEKARLKAEQAAEGR